MNFFQQQEIARRNTRFLVFTFVVAVAILVVITNFVIVLFLFGYEQTSANSGEGFSLMNILNHLDWHRFMVVGLVVVTAVASVSMFRWFQLSSGGKVVAEAMGGTPVLPHTRDKRERRCLNVVEEMALAANMPVPPLYVLNDERGINAFVAGITPADAIVAVTRGAINQLKRNELQGVIGHEFSHILNGDMRLSIRLAAVLKGITFIGDAGETMLHFGHIRSGRNNVAGNVVLGAALWIIGSLGGLAAGFIKAGISRQKEYLADASAVQFTRNPDDIAGALKVIGGYVPGTLVHAARAEEMSHIFFGEIRHRLWDLFATHPPLDDRIRRVDPQWDGEYINRIEQHYENNTAKKDQGLILDTANIAMGALAARIGSEVIEKNIEELASKNAKPAANKESELRIDKPEPLEYSAIDIPEDFSLLGFVEEQKQSQESQADYSTVEFESATLDTSVLVASKTPAELPIVLVSYAHEPLGAHALMFALLMDKSSAIFDKQLEIVAAAKIDGLEERVKSLFEDSKGLDSSQRLPLLEMCMPALKTMSYRQYRVFKDTLLKIIKADNRIELFEWCMFQLTRHYLDPEFVKVKISRPRYRNFKKVCYHLRVVLSVIAYEDGEHDAKAAFRVGADDLGFTELEILSRDQCGVAAFGKAVETLADCYPLLKPKLLKALIKVASNNGIISAPEREIIVSIAAIMDCPMPELNRKALKLV